MAETFGCDGANQIIRGEDAAEAVPGFYPYLNVEGDAAYQQVPLSPDEAYVIGSHFGQVSHIVGGKAADVITAIGRGVGDASRPQHAVFISEDYPPRAIVYERIDP